MKKIIRLTGICYLFIIIILGQISLLTVYAAEQSKDSKETKIYDIDASAHTDDDELTQGFYLPKSSFRSDESYQDFVSKCTILDTWTKTETGLLLQKTLSTIKQAKI